VETTGLIVLAGLVFLFAVFSKRLARTAITGPMLFVTAGLLLGPVGLDVVAADISDVTVQMLFELTLALVLFTDATEVSLRTLREEVPLAGRLLGIGMPLTMVLGGGVATVMFTDLSFWEGMLVGVILAPTDAALGQAVVSNRRVPERIRQALNVESGLNDGLALPIFALVLAIAQAEYTAGSGTIVKMVVDLGAAIAIGGAVGAFAGWLMRYASEHGWVGRTWRSIAPAAIALLCFGLADFTGASGFLAAFVGGVLFGFFTRKALPDIVVFSDGAAHLLTMLSFFVFGAMILAPRLGDLTWSVAVYAVASLTLIRLVPVAISMLGSNLEWESVVYLGWFGPRGLASIVFASIVFLEADLPGTELIILLMAATVGLSVYLHGATAWHGSNAYSDWAQRMGDEMEDMTEGGEVEHKVRRSRLGF